MNNKTMKRIAIDINDVVRNFSKNFGVVYQKFVDSSLDTDKLKITDFDLSKVFNFKSKQEYSNFVYIDYPYELFGCAEACHRNLGARLCDWIGNDLTNIEDRPEILLVSPFEYALTIQSTCHFLSHLPCRIREIYFPEDSRTIWNRCDILITANPNLLSSVPEGKTVVKIKTDYNGHCEAEHEYNSLMDLMNDEEQKFIKLLEQ
jgi:hypothetical protein